MTSTLLGRQQATLAALTTFDAHDFIRSSDNVTSSLRKTLAGVAKVYTDGFDAEQVWEQLQLLVCAGSQSSA
jgi:U3 small nucleolar ribonucleoprotein component